MKIIGITGSIGTGKSTVLGIFSAEGIPGWQADEAVSQIYQSNTEVQKEIQNLFGRSSVGQNGVKKNKLKEILSSQPELIKPLENIVHPKVKEHRQKFIDACHQLNSPLVVLEIPLLFETGIDKEVDYVIVVTASPEVQLKRMRERKGMNEEWFAKIQEWQMDNTVKIQKSDFIVTSDTHADTRSQIRLIIKELTH
ncbi:MAG: dephospho-CoA kinase [Rhodobacteraceae bacterium]|nr:dephospho-CoA kinase [Paracoccaceae bacterium]